MNAAVIQLSSDWTFFAEHRAEIFSATLDHLALVLIAMAIAILIGVPLGMFIVQRPALRTIALGIASIFQTIPSLALFGFPFPSLAASASAPPSSLLSCMPFSRSSAIHTWASRESIPPSLKLRKPWA